MPLDGTIQPKLTSPKGEGFQPSPKGTLSESRVIPLKLYRNVRGKIFFTHTSNEATCFGDSGGMTYLQRPDGQVKLVAVVSGVGQLADNPEVCSAKNYSFHTWLYPHLEWIRDLMEKETD